MRRTILSENQYEPKFMIAANTKADHQPVRAAEQFADARAAAPLISPSSSAVFIPLAIYSFYCRL